MPTLNDAKLFAGNANRPLACAVATALKIKLAKIDVAKFSDNEIRIEIEEHIRQETAFILQPTCAPANDNLMEFLIMADAIRRSAPTEIIGIIPYYGYARQDRRPEFTRTPITSRLVADMIQIASVDQLIVVDLHSEQQCGFFTIPVTNISAAPVIVSDIWRTQFANMDNLVIVSPDTGGVARARSIAKQLNDADLAIIDKRRPDANVSVVMHVIGDVEGKHCIMYDDMIDTAGTLCKAADALKANGAKSVMAYATHAVFSGKAYDNIENSVLDEVIVTDTIPLPTEKSSSKIRVISLANLLAETILRINEGRSVSAMYA